MLNLTNTTDIPSTNGPNNSYIYTLYIFALLTVGASTQKLVHLASNSGKGWLNIFVILPLITLVTATVYIILDIERAFSHGLTDDQLIFVNITQYVLDFPSSVCLQVVLWVRLHILLKAESKLGSFTVLSHVIKVLLFVPITWIIVDTLGIVVTFRTEYTQIAVDIFGFYNILTGVYDIILHSIFLYIFIYRVPSVRNNQKWKRKLTFLIVVVVINSAGLAFGGIYSFFDGPSGYVIIYATWLNEVFVFLLLNDIVGTMLKSSKATKSQSLNKNTVQ